MVRDWDLRWPLFQVDNFERELFPLQGKTSDTGATAGHKSFQLGKKSKLVRDLRIIQKMKYDLCVDRLGTCFVLIVRYETLPVRGSLSRPYSASLFSKWGTEPDMWRPNGTRRYSIFSGIDNTRTGSDDLNPECRE